MVGNNATSRTFAHHNMTATLAGDNKSEFLQGSYAFATADARELGMDNLKSCHQSRRGVFHGKLLQVQLCSLLEVG